MHIMSTSIMMSLIVTLLLDLNSVSVRGRAGNPTTQESKKDPLHRDIKKQNTRTEGCSTTTLQCTESYPNLSYLIYPPKLRASSTEAMHAPTAPLRFHSRVRPA